MSVQWRWYNDQHTILCFIFYDPWTLEEFLIADQDAGQTVAKLQWIVDAIMDFSQAKTLPKNVMSGIISSIKRSASWPNIGASVVIHAGPVLRPFIHIIQRLSPEDTILIAEDLTGAEQIITSLQTKRLDHQ